MNSPGISLGSLLHQTAAASPDRLAVQFRNRRLSYGRLEGILEAMGQKLGPLAGMRIVILLPDGLPSYLCHLYFFLSGATVLPVSIQSTTLKIRELCETTQPHFAVTNPLLRARHKEALEGLPCLVVKSDGTDAPWGFDYETLGFENVLGDHGKTLCAESESVRMIVFTSGSTGKPKGVCLSEANILAAAGMNVSFLSLGPLRNSLVTVPLYDYYGFIQIYSHILANCGYILGESMVFPDQLLRRIREEKVTDLVLVPHTLREMLRIIGEHYTDVIRDLRYMTSSSDTLTSDLLKRVFVLNPDLKVFNIYGLTEAGRACYREIDRSSVPSNSIGRPSPGVEIRLDGPEGEPGEIIIRGPNVMVGYFREICDDRIVFNPCTEMRTGDLGYYDEKGEIILVGRRDHMINMKGEKIHPSEIEGIALQVPGVVEALARARQDNGGKVSIYLDLVMAGDACDLEAVRGHMRRNLSPHFFPREINVVPGINRTELGSKIVRGEDRK